MSCERSQLLELKEWLTELSEDVGAVRQSLRRAVSAIEMMESRCLDVDQDDQEPAIPHRRIEDAVIQRVIQGAASRLHQLSEDLRHEC